jgi:DNA-directed RNA polymerase subunit RPC12/RpoP
MHVYVCNDCGKIQTSKSRPYDKSTCPETRWGGIGGSTNGKANGDHEYQEMGNSGSQQYVCSGCKTSIMLFQKPTNSGACGAGGTNTFNHQWQKH